MAARAERLVCVALPGLVGVPTPVGVDVAIALRALIILLAGDLMPCKFHAGAVFVVEIG